MAVAGAALREFSGTWETSSLTALPHKQRNWASVGKPCSLWLTRTWPLSETLAFECWTTRSGKQTSKRDEA